MSEELLETAETNEDYVDPPTPGPVQETKDILAEKELDANLGTPEGMEFIGWVLDGWLTSYPLLNDLARPVYALKQGVQ